VRAGLVEHPRSYPWSSHGANAFGERDSLVSPHEAYTQLGRNESARQTVYRGFFDIPLDETTVTTIGDATQKGWTLGSKKFRQEIATLVGRRTDALRVWQARGTVERRD
jgi:putative transposase